MGQSIRRKIHETMENTTEGILDQKTTTRSRSNRSKNLNREKLLKHARPLNNFSGEKGEYIYAPKSVSNLGIYVSNFF
jgi:hypothetical protein